MRKFIQSAFFGILLLQLVYTAPTETVSEDSRDLKKLDDTEESRPQTLLDESNDGQSAQGQRQKRWYNFYGFPPANPVIYNKRDDFPNTGVYGLEDPFVQIHRRLQEISGFVRQPVPPPLPPALPQFPPFFPVLYIPQIGCACTPDNTPNRPNPAPPQNNNTTTDNPNVNNRWPEMEDERQNWGFVLNDTQTDDNEGDINDGARPISFDPITPNRPLSRPPPPVEHGTAQGGPSSITTPTTVAPPPVTTSRLQPPSTCDGAVLSCCHMPQVTYDCFALQGCPDPSAYGNPCDPSVIVRVIERFREFYNQRTG